MPLYGVGPTDPLTYATVPALLVGVALLAAMAPPAGRCAGSECRAATGVGAWRRISRIGRSGIQGAGKARQLGPTGTPDP